MMPILPMMTFVAVALSPIAAIEGPFQASSQDESTLTASLVTIGPGAEIWERFGHNALWIHDPDAPTGQRDVAYDYGRFDFNAEHFFLKFALGDMHYSMDSATVDRIVSGYAARGRSVTIQRLNLSESQIRTLEARLQEDVGKVRSPEGWTYPYDYYLDNCSTRLRDALDLVLGGQLRDALTRRETGTTYRFHSLRSVTNNLGYYFAIDLMLGPRADRSLTAWETAFLPEGLEEALEGVRVVDVDGETLALVADQMQVVRASRYEVPAAPPPWDAGLFFGGVGVAAVGMGAARGGVGRRGWFRAIALTLLGGWVVITAVAGLVLTLLWTVSRHEIAYFNANLFFANLVSLVMLVSFPSAIRGQPRGGRIIGLLAALSAGLALLGVLLAQTGLTGQPVGPVGWVATPIWLGLALAARWLFPQEEQVTRS